MSKEVSDESKEPVPEAHGSDETDALTQRQYRVSNIASTVIEVLLQHFDTEEAYNNREGFEENLLGEMYGRMVVAHMLGYDPVAFAEDAEAASDRIKKLVAEEGEQE
jgi:hypothetical protein